MILVAAVALGIRSYLHAGSTEVTVESIAVIPFVNQSKDANSEWISDGLTESIINNLTQLPNLKVLELNPNYATGHQWLAEHHSSLKRFDQAISEIQRALDLDPLSAIISPV